MEVEEGLTLTGRHDIGHVPSPKEPVRLEDTVAVPRGTSLASRALRLDLTQLLLIVVSALLLSILFQLSHPPRYQDMTTSPNNLKFDEELNALGASGWKTGSCRRATCRSEYGGTDASYECIMSRPKLGW